VIRSKIVGMDVSFGLAIVLLFSVISSARSQTSPLIPQFTFPQLTAPQIISNTEIDRGVVRLDGRRLFPIAVPAMRDRPNGTPIDTRVQNIETNLAQLAERNLDPNPPQVTAAIDAASNLPIISVNDRYVMTVTLLDAQLQGQQPSSYAKELTQIIRTALIAAKRERQPDALVCQGMQAALIVAMMLLDNYSGWGIGD
jgi:moderate conductance mechanosensitive channel